MFDWQVFCPKLLILPNLFDVNGKETISERWEAVWCLFYWLSTSIWLSGFKHIASHTIRQRQLMNQTRTNRITHTVILQSLPCRFWSNLLLKQKYKILLFCGSCDVEITSSKNDLTIKAALLLSCRLDLTKDFQE